MRDRIDKIQADYLTQVALVDANALKLYHDESPEAAVNYVTQFTVSAGERLHDTWLKFYGELFAKFRDFATFEQKEGETRCGCQVSEPGLSEEVKRRIVLETGGHYEVPVSGNMPNLRPGRGEPSQHFL